MAVTIQVRTTDLKRASKALNALAARASDLRPLMEEISAFGEDSTRRRFETQTSPDGEKWAPTHRGGNILVDKGHLRDSITARAGTDSAEWGSNLIYAGIHQHGGEIKAKTPAGLIFSVGGRSGANRKEFVRKQSVTIPARPFLGLSAGDEREISQIVEDYLAEGLT
jgi:phage virion morphogenesis protein